MTRIVTLEPDPAVEQVLARAVAVRPRHPQPPALVSKDGTILGTLVQSRRLWITGGAVCWLTGDQLARINALPRRTA